MDLNEVLSGVLGGLKDIEPLEIEKRAQSIAERILIALTSRDGLVYTTDEKTLKATISMCLAIADEFVAQANSRFDKVRADVEGKMQAKMQEAQSGLYNHREKLKRTMDDLKKTTSEEKKWDGKTDAPDTGETPQG